MMNTRELYQTYLEKMRLIADVRNATSVLQWDQETFLPPNGALARGRQISTLSEISHKMFSDEALGDLLKKLLDSNEISGKERRNVELTREDYQKNRKYSSAFVRKMSDQVNKAFHSWIASRKQNSFAVFENDLADLIQLKKQESDILGYSGHPYNAHLNEFEKGATIAFLDSTFSYLLPALRDLIKRIAAQTQVDDSFLKLNYPVQQQMDWSMELIRFLHFDLNSGRQDISEHPFSISFNSKDVRITTRIDENDFGNMTWSCIHEVGHGLYEQGLPEDQYGLPLGEACSYSIHESQSRLWENNVGRSKNFWTYYFPVLKKYFPQQLANTGLDEFYKGINKVQPSFIRTEADEITYHFHVFIRYELEKQLLDNSVSAHDIPTFWNESYKKWMDLDIPDDRNGCLQDVHWSHGSFGYFPTYSLGSLYASQFYTAAKLQVKDLEVQIREGNTRPLLDWLRLNVHDKGRSLTSEQLCTEISGKSLDSNEFIDNLLYKYISIYTL